MKTQRETPNWLIAKMIRLLDVRNNQRILEPSCGEGKIINKLIDYSNSLDLDLHISGIELNEEKFNSCSLNIKKLQKPVILKHGDFLNTNPNSYKFNRIIACPPFKNGLDQRHIIHMYDLLQDNGIIVTLTNHSKWMVGSTNGSQIFREWLSKLDHKLIILPDNTFIEKHKSVPTSILMIKK